MIIFIGLGDIRFTIRGSNCLQSQSEKRFYALILSHCYKKKYLTKPTKQKNLMNSAGKVKEMVWKID